MDVHIITILLSCIPIMHHVASFTITGGQEGSTNLVKALSTLHRQRRRTETQFTSSEHSFSNRPLSEEDISDLLDSYDASAQRLKSKDKVTLVSNSLLQPLKPFLRDGYISKKRQLISFSEEPQGQEINDIFATSYPGSENDSRLASMSESKMMMKQRIGEKKKTVIEPAKTVDESGYLSLGTLTKEEVNALISALDKLKKQYTQVEAHSITTLEDENIKRNDVPKSSDFGISMDLYPDKPKPNSDQDDLQFVSKIDSTVNQITSSGMESRLGKQDTFSGFPKTNFLRKSELDLIKKIFSELKEDVVETAEKDLTDTINEDMARGQHEKTLPNPIKPSYLRRNIKRSVNIIPYLLNDLLDEDFTKEKGDKISDLNEREISSNSFLKYPSPEMFMRKIASLQEKVSKIKIVSMLEGMENDVLTDALNEASLRQDDDSVSEEEYRSLQDAVNIEKTIQVLKKTKIHGSDSANELEKEGLQRETSIENKGNNFLSAGTSTPYSRKGRKFTRDDIQRLLGQTYIIKEQESRDNRLGLTSILSPETG